MNEFSLIQIAHAANNTLAAKPEVTAEAKSEALPLEAGASDEVAAETLTGEPGQLAGAEEGGLQINPYTIGFQALNFLILLVLLNLILYKPLVKLLKDREKKIRDGVENAEKAEGMLKESHLIRDDMIRSAKVETQGMLEKARVSGEKVRAEILGEAQKEADHVIKSGHSLIEMERGKAAEDFKGLAVNLIIKATEKLLREKLNDQKDAQMIKESLNSMI